MLLSRDHLQRVYQSIATANPDGGVRWPISIGDLERRSRINQERRSRVVAIRFSSRNPIMAADVANRIAEIYVQSQSLRRQEATSRIFAANAEWFPKFKVAMEQAGAAMQQLRIAHGLDSDAYVLSRAEPPDRPSSVNPILFILLSLIGLSICACLMAVIREQFDTSLRSPTEIQGQLGVPCIGLVPRSMEDSGQVAYRLPIDKPMCAYSEAIRSASFELLQLHQPLGGPKTILITSSIAQEGRTTLAFSIAVYAAKLGRRVLLIDLDCRSAHGPRAFDQLLAGRPLENLVEQLPLLQLDYLPAVGRSAWEPPTATPGGELQTIQTSEPLAVFIEPMTERAFRLLREAYDYVIIDGPPLLATTEARIIAGMVDRVVLAVKWGSSDRQTVSNALRLLRRSGLQQRDSSTSICAIIVQADLRQHALYHFGDDGDSLALIEPARRFSFGAWAQALLSRVRSRAPAHSNGQPESEKGNSA